MIKQKREILKAASEFTGLSDKMITGRSRQSDILMTRDAVCVVLKKVYGLTDASIATSIGRDRSTVSYAARRHAKRYNKVMAYRQLFNHLLAVAEGEVKA